MLIKLSPYDDSPMTEVEAFNYLMWVDPYEGGRLEQFEARLDRLTDIIRGLLTPEQILGLLQKGNHSEAMEVDADDERLLSEYLEFLETPRTRDEILRNFSVSQHERFQVHPNVVRSKVGKAIVFMA